MENLMQYLTGLFAAIGMLAFVVSGITQVIKELPGLKKIPTNVIVLVLSISLCILATAILCSYLQRKLFWYYIAGAVMLSFFVYLVATGGWKKISKLWNQTRYRNHH